jgi:cytochrome b pre-mRNA-processing protein 3
MINHYFIHAEGLMRGRYKVKQGRLIKGYLRDMLYQYHGANMGYDEGLISENDAVLAAAVWMNLFGAGWGKMGGVKGKLNQDKPLTEAELKAEEKEEETPLAKLNLDPSLPPSPEIPNQMGGMHAGGTGLVEPLPRHDPAGFAELQLKEARFALCLERLVKFIRSEVHRMEKIPDEVVMRGVGATQDRVSGVSAPGSLTAFGRI